MSKRNEDKALIKSLYKYMLEKYKKSDKKDAAQAVVADVLDANHVAEVDPNKIPSKKNSVMSKASPYREAKKIATKEKGQKGVHTSGGFSGLQREGRSQAGNEITSRAPKAGNKYLKEMHHERGKEMHREKLKELKAMPKPNLTKSQKGVHDTRAEYGNAGQSRAGAYAATARRAKSYKAPGSKEVHNFNMESAKQIHKEKLKELKAMPKPNLPKNEETAKVKALATKKIKKPKVKGVKRLKNYMKKNNRCWDGYEPTPGKKPYSEGSCKKKG